MKITPEKLFQVVRKTFKEIPFMDLMALASAEDLSKTPSSVKAAFEAAAKDLNEP